jgi:O-antigen ligase
MSPWISSLRRWLRTDFGLGLSLGLLFLAAMIVWQFSGRGNILALAFVGLIGAAILLQWPFLGALYISFSLFARMASILPGTDTAIVILTLLSYGFRKLLAGNLSWRFPASARWAVLLIAWLALSITWAQSAANGVAALVMYLKSLLLFFVVLEAAQNYRKIIHLIYAALAGGILSALISAYTGFRFFFGGAAAQLSTMVAVENTRLYGQWYDPNYFALALLALLGIAFSLWRTGWRPVARVFAAAGFVFVTIGIVLSLSRGAILATLVALALCLWVERRRVPILVFVLAFIVLLLAVVPVNLVERIETMTTAARDASIHRRSQLLSGGIEMTIDSFPLGVGLGNFLNHSLSHAKIDTPKLAHNSYLDFAAEGGVVALLLFAGFVVSLVRATRVPRFRFDPASWSDGLAIGLRISLIAFLLGATFLSAGAFGPLWWLAGMVAAKAACDAEVESQEARAPVALQPT